MRMTTEQEQRGEDWKESNKSKIDQGSEAFEWRWRRKVV